LTDQSESMAALRELRGQIEALDRDIIATIARRVRLARETARLKRAAAQPVLDPPREAAVVRRAAELAAAHELPAEAVRAIFWQLIGLCREEQYPNGDSA
jgi:chorismate mutase